jgi:hypothetical protein
MADDLYYQELEDEMLDKATKRDREDKNTKRALTDQPDTTLMAPFEARETITKEELAELTKPVYENPVVSLYLNLTPDKVIRELRVYLTYFNSLKKIALRRDAEFVKGLDHFQKESLESDLQEVEKYLSGNFDPEGEQTLVLFVSGEQLRRAYRLKIRTTDYVTVGKEPYTFHLANAFEVNKPLLITHLERELCVFYEYYLGNLKEIHRVELDLPNLNVDISPTHIQSHNLEAVHRHLKNIGEYISSFIGSHGDYYLMFEGEEKLIKEFMQKELHKSLQDKVIYTFAEGNLMEEIRKGLENHEEEVEKKNIAEMEKYNNTGQLVQGVSEVLKAGNRYFISQLLVRDDLQMAGYRCPKDQYFTLEEKDCPMCGQKAVFVENIVDEMVAHAAQNKMDVTIVRKHKEMLEPYQGIVGIKYSPAMESTR